jgi:hypothetical protein
MWTIRCQLYIVFCSCYDIYLFISTSVHGCIWFSGLSDIVAHCRDRELLIMVFAEVSVYMVTTLPYSISVLETESESNRLFLVRVRFGSTEFSKRRFVFALWCAQTIERQNWLVCVSEWLLLFPFLMRLKYINRIELISQISQITNNNNQLFDDFLLQKYHLRENSPIDNYNCTSTHLIQIWIWMRLKMFFPIKISFIVQISNRDWQYASGKHLCDYLVEVFLNWCYQNKIESVVTSILYHSMCLEQIHLISAKEKKNVIEN